MKKTMTKVFALILVLAMIIGFVAMIPANAATEDSVQFVAHNVYFDDYLQIMYAVYIPDGTTLEKIVLSDGTNEFSAELFEDENNAPTYNGKECARYVAVNGVALQNIDTVVTAKAYVNGAVVAEDEYSILQYLHKRLVVDNIEDTNKVAMYQSLLDAAEAMQTVINGGVTLHETSYVNVINGTIDGTNAEGMVKVGDALANVTTSLVAGEGQEIEWTVTEYTDAGVAGVSVTKTTEEVQALVVENGVNLVLEAGLKEIGAEDTDVIADGEYVIVANGTAAMGAELSNNKLSGIAVKVTNGVATGSGAPLWTVTNVDGGVTLSYDGQYLAHSSSSSTNLALQTEAYTWTVVEGENGEIYLDSTTEATRGLMYRDGTNNVFGAYATSNAGTSGYHRAMLFCAFEECAHANTTTENAVSATCGVNGYTGDKVCTDCGATIEEGNTIDATGEHTYTDGTCSVCGATEPSAGTTTIAFELGTNKSTTTHADGSTKTEYTETVDDYTLKLTATQQFYTGANDAKGNAAIKLGSSSKVGGFTFTVPEEVTSVVIYVAGYKAKSVTVTANGTSTDITTLSDNGEYTAITIDTSVTKDITFTTTSTGYRAMVNTIEYVIEE